MKSHAPLCGTPTIAIPKIGCGLGQMNWQEVVKLLRDVFAHSNIRIVVYTLKEIGVHALSSDGDRDFYAEDEIERYSGKFYLIDRYLETDFTTDAKSCQPTCDEQFPTFRKKEYSNLLIEHCLLYQPRKLVQHVKEFHLQFSDSTHEEMTLLIDMLIDSRDVYSQHKFDVGKSHQKFHVKLKPKVELKKQRPSKEPLQLRKKIGKTSNST